MKIAEIREPTLITMGTERLIAVPVLEAAPDVPEKDRMVLVVMGYSVIFRKQKGPKLERWGKELFNDRGSKLSPVEEGELFKHAYRKFKVRFGSWRQGDEA